MATACRNGLERRITVLMTAMLTMMAFNVYLGDMLPRVAYMTFLHQVGIRTAAPVEHVA